MSTSVVSRRESSLYRHSYPDFRCSAMRECGDRIRRERTAPLSPRLALRRVLVLAEGRQFREAAAVLARLGPTALSAVASEIPLELLLDGLPHSAQLLETLFSRYLLFRLTNLLIRFIF